jgi:hypothetical protein
MTAAAAHLFEARRQRRATAIAARVLYSDLREAIDVIETSLDFECWIDGLPTDYLAPIATQWHQSRVDLAGIVPSHDWERLRGIPTAVRLATESYAADVSLEDDRQRFMAKDCLIRFHEAAAALEPLQTLAD